MFTIAAPTVSGLSAVSIVVSAVSIVAGKIIPEVTYTLPFAHLNLRRNPFGEFSVEEWTRLADVEVEEFDEFLREPGSALQFVGEKGYGKTTHLLAIRSRFPDAAYVHIPEGERAEIPDGNPQLIDEAQRLTRQQKRRAFHSNVPLVLGTHRDFDRELARAGRRVRTIAVGDRMNSTLLSRILNSRIEWVRRDEGPVPGVPKGPRSWVSDTDEIRSASTARKAKRRRHLKGKTLPIAVARP